MARSVLVMIFEPIASARYGIGLIPAGANPGDDSKN
jgi:hypothetical protein